MTGSAFTILQQKSVAVKVVDMSPSMDIIAFIFEDGSLVLFRTISWLVIDGLIYFSFFECAILDLID